jgi:FG-GAP-like repeat/FG-GAP repeat
VGFNPTQIVAGDFNGNGIEDFATWNLSTNVTVLLGTASGGFTAAVGSPFALETIGASTMAVGDFNGDGLQDLAVVNVANGSVNLLLGNGSGGFTRAPATAFSVNNAAAVAVGDFNGDGIEDLAVTTAYLTPANVHLVNVLFGNGSGGFSGSVPFVLETGSYYALVLADFNGDGFLDLAAANGSGGDITVLLGGLTPTGSVLSTSSPLTITFGQTVALTLAVSGSAIDFNAPTGSATFYDGTTVLGTASQNTAPYTFSALPQTMPDG